MCPKIDIDAVDPRIRARFERQEEEAIRLTREQREELAGLFPQGTVRFDEPMSRHCTMRVGGPAEALATVEDVDQLKRLLEWASERRVDYLFWGGGSNTLVRDGGIRGLVVKLGGNFDFIKIDHRSGGEAFLSAGAATPTARLIGWCAENGVSGLEPLAGVCGTVGGNLITNAGTEEGRIADAVDEITVVDRDRRELTFKRPGLRFEYRKLKLPRTFAIIRALFRLEDDDGAAISGRVDEILRRRAGAQPEGVASLGCVFKNPGKTAAGFLIEEAGLKGVRVGGARVSTVHANFIVNEGGATARDVIVLMNLVRDRVREQTGFTLEPEINVVGDR